MALTLETGLGLAYGVITVALACFFYFSGPANRANRAFTFFLFVYGFGGLLSSYVGLIEDPLGGYWRRVVVYFGAPIQSVVLMLFLSAYPHRRKWIPAGILGWLPFLITILLMDGLYAADHANFIDFTRIEDGTFGRQYQPGPIVFLFVLFALVFPVAPLLLMRDHARLRPGPGRRAILFLAMGVPIVPLYIFFENLARNLLFAGDPFASQYLGTSFDHPIFLLTQILGVALRLIFFAYLFQMAFRGRDPEVRTGARVFVVLIAAMIVSVVSASAGSWTSLDSFNASIALPRAVWPIVRDVCVIYALLRHGLFDIDIKIKWGIRRGTVAAVLLAIFFVVAQVAQTFLTQEYGLLLGGVAAGLMLFFLAPLHRFAERVSEAALPGVKPLDALSADERGEFYLEQARLAWADGSVDRSERLMLDRLRERLGLSRDDAGRLESMAARDAPAV